MFLMAGASLIGVALRTVLAGEMVPLMLAGSRQSLSGLLGGGGPGLSEKLRGLVEEETLETRCNNTGWLANRLGAGWRISTSLPALGNLTGNSSRGSASLGTGVPALVVDCIG